MSSNHDFSSKVSEPPVTGGYSAGSYLPPAPPPTTYDLHPPQDDETQDGPTSTTDVAKDQAANIAGGTADAAQHVAGVAKEQVGQVTAEAGKQVKQLVGQAQSELSGQAQVQQQKLAGGLHSVGDQLKAMAQNSDQSGVATDLAHQAADKAHQVAGWLDDRDPGSVLNEVRAYARKRPGAFLALALGAGLVAGRLARGLAADPDDKADTATKNELGSPGASSSGRPILGRPAPAAALPGGTQQDRADVYGSGQVPDWTGKTTADLGEPR